MNVAFDFCGSIPPSKSLLIRQQLLTLYEPKITLPLASKCSDVVAMRGACAAFRDSQPDSQPSAGHSPQIVHCGEAGLVLRLCLGYAARLGGDFLLTGARRLIERPHEPLLYTLRQLGAEISAQLEPTPALRVRSSGWQPVAGPLSLSGGLSSQFASSLLLNAWDLSFPLHISCDPEPVSEGYLEMSIDTARRFGMQITQQKEADKMSLIVPPKQQIQAMAAMAEADVSSAFAVAALAAVAGTAQIRNFPQHSLQPDHCFVDLLRQMGVPITLSAEGLRVRRAVRLQPLSVDLGGAPDLVPVLAVLCALSDGESRLFGAPQLRGKESDRIATTAALLTLLGRENRPLMDGIEILGRPVSDDDRARSLAFDATGDHRLVMAAAVARWAGFPIGVRGLSSVHKSFPEFVSLAGLSEGSPSESAKESS